MAINPFRLRPDTSDKASEPRAEALVGDTGDWANNGMSNIMAWASRVFLPSWCDAPGHWTSRFMKYFQTSCPCCLFFRGISVGLALGLGVGLIAGALF
jgi:hypothetical protein